VLVGIADRVAVHRHARHAVRRRRVQTDGKPLRFSILAGDTYYTAEAHMMLP
jgi:hypothetical protein